MHGVLVGIFGLVEMMGPAVPTRPVFGPPRINRSTRHLPTQPHSAGPIFTRRTNIRPMIVLPCVH